MVISKVLFSSLSDDWKTPKSLYEKLNREFHFNYDPCPIEPKENGLYSQWKERNFINPPYSDVARWVEKAWSESIKGKLCVLLLASRTDTIWFHRYVLPYANEVRFLKGRVCFTHKTGKRGRSPFPSMIVIFRGNPNG